MAELKKVLDSGRSGRRANNPRVRKRRLRQRREEPEEAQGPGGKGPGRRLRISGLDRPADRRRARRTGGALSVSRRRHRSARVRRGRLRRRGAGVALADWTSQDAEAAAGLESLTPSESALFWQVPKGRSVDTPFAKRSAKTKYKSVITTRNLRTMRKILATTARNLAREGRVRRRTAVERPDHHSGQRFRGEQRRLARHPVAGSGDRRHRGHRGRIQQQRRATGWRGPPRSRLRRRGDSRRHLPGRRDPRRAG